MKPADVEYCPFCEAINSLRPAEALEPGDPPYLECESCRSQAVPLTFNEWLVLKILRHEVPSIDGALRRDQVDNILMIRAVFYLTGNRCPELCNCAEIYGRARLLAHYATDPYFDHIGRRKL